MGTKTGIEWTDHTFNPWIGCTKVSDGCKNCYAKSRDDRHMLGPESHWGPGAPRHITSAGNWKQPQAWARAARKTGKRERVFCASLADVFDIEAPAGAQRRLFELIDETAYALDWQILTKRPQNIGWALDNADAPADFLLKSKCWLGVSTEDQAKADQRIPLLLKTPAAVRFISAEPLLGPVGLTLRSTEPDEYWWHDTLTGLFMCDGMNEGRETPSLDWVICGGESGPGARPMKVAWARGLRDECAAAGVPFFFKQGSQANWKDFKDFDAFPCELQVRQFPEVSNA